MRVNGARSVAGFLVHSDHLIGKGWRWAGSLMLAVFLAAGAALAHAAEPSGLDRLPSEVVGVTGSGDALRLQVKSDGQVRTLVPGDEYRDGWKLRSVSASKATLFKSGETREVGLNPTGALASNAATAPPSDVSLVGGLSSEVIEAAWDKRMNDPKFANVAWPRTGFDLNEEKRMTAYDDLLYQYQTQHPGQPQPTGDYDLAVSLYGKVMVEDYMALMSKWEEGMRQRAANMTTAEWQAETNADQRSVDFLRQEMAALDPGDPEYAQYSTSLSVNLRLIQQIKDEHGVSPQSVTPP